MAGTSATSRACLCDAHASLAHTVPRTLALTGRRLPSHRRALSMAVIITATVVATAERRLVEYTAVVPTAVAFIPVTAIAVAGVVPFVLVGLVLFALGPRPLLDVYRDRRRSTPDPP